MKPGAAIGLGPRGRAASYQEALLRHLHAQPGGMLGDDELGVSRSLSDAGVIQGMNPRSVSASLSLLERQGRIVSEWGHRSLDNTLCRLRVLVVAEPVAGFSSPPTSTPAAKTRAGDANSAVDSLAGFNVPPGLVAEISAHVDHLASDLADSETMLEEAFAELEFALGWAEECEAEIERLGAATGAEGAFDDLVAEDRRLRVRLAWAERRLARRDASIDVLAGQADSLRRELGAIRSERDREGGERQRLSARLARTETALSASKKEAGDLAGDLADTRGRLDLVKTRLLFVAVSSIAEAGEANQIEAVATQAMRVLWFGGSHPRSETASLRHFKRFAEVSDHPSPRSVSLDELKPAEREALDEAPVDPHLVRRLLAVRHGTWWPQLLQLCAWLEDSFGEPVTVSRWNDDYETIALPALAGIEDGHLVGGGGKLPLRVDPGATLPPQRSLVVAAPDAFRPRRVDRSTGTVYRVDRKAIYLGVEDPGADVRGAFCQVDRRALDKAVDQSRVEVMLSRPGRLFGILASGPEEVGRRLAAAACMVGMSGVSKIVPLGDDRREVELRGCGPTLKGRFLYGSGDEGVASIELRRSYLAPWYGVLVGVGPGGKERFAIALALAPETV